LQSQTLASQELGERRALVAKRCATLARVSVEIDEDVGAMPRIRHNTMLAGPRAPPQTGVSDDWIYD